MKTDDELREEFWTKMKDADSLCDEYVLLKKSLSYAIAEADGWHDDSRGGPIDTPEMSAAREVSR